MTWNLRGLLIEQSSWIPDEVQLTGERGDPDMIVELNRKNRKEALENDGSTPQEEINGLTLLR